MNRFYISRQTGGLAMSITASDESDEGLKQIKMRLKRNKRKATKEGRTGT